MAEPYPQLFSGAQIIRSQGASLGVMEWDESSRFVPQRGYWINFSETSTPRGHHAHKSLQQEIVCLKGAIAIRLSSPKISWDFELTENSEQVVYVPAGLWRELYPLTDNTLVLVLASAHYNEDDYIRSWEDFVEWSLRRN